jgi:hypothetical protein
VYFEFIVNVKSPSGHLGRSNQTGVKVLMEYYGYIYIFSSNIILF